MAEEMTEGWDLEEAKKKILEYEPNIEDDHFDGYLILMAAFSVGCDHIYKLTRATKLGRDVVGSFVRRMRKSGLFSGDQVCWEDCGGDPEHESLQFTLYVMVGLGLLVRHPSTDESGSSYSSN